MTTAYKTTKDRVIDDCLAFCQETGIDIGPLGRLAIGDSRMVDRLMSGGTISIDKLDILYVFMGTRSPNFTNPFLEIPNERRKENQGTKGEGSALPGA